MTEPDAPQDGDVTTQPDDDDRSSPDGDARSSAKRDRGEPAASREAPGLETRVDDADAVAATCRYCGRPFATAAAHDLHVGDVHAERCTPEETARYETALEVEHDELFYFHLRVVAALAVLYTVVVLAYMIALGSGYL